MSENTEKSKLAQSIMDNLAKLTGLESVKLTSELAEGEYKLEDGTTFKIDADGNLVDVVAPDPEAAIAEEAAKDEEVAMQKQALETLEAEKVELEKQLKEAKEKNETLEAEKVELTKTKKIVTTPKAAKFEKIELTSNMTKSQRALARLKNLENQ